MQATATTDAAADRRRMITGVIFGLCAAMSYGASQVLARHSVSDLAPPLLGSAMALFWGTLGFSLLSLRGLVNQRASLKRGAWFFVAAGIFSSLGVMGLFQALSRGQVVVVSPVVSTNPLFTLLWAAIFLREVERISTQVVVGAVLVVAGVAVLTIF